MCWGEGRRGLARVPGEVLAGILGVGIRKAPGGHVGYVTHAAEFAGFLLKELLGVSEARL